MIFQRRFHSHTPTSIDSPPTPPPKDTVSPAKTLEQILGIAVSPRAPKPPPHAVGTVASNPRIFKTTPLRSASSPLKSSAPRRAPSSRKTGHATIHTDPVGGHDAFESDAFAVHMPTTRIPIIDAPVSRPKIGSSARAQAEAVQTYKEKAEQARKRNNNVGVRVPNNIASYDYAYANTPKPGAAIPAVLKPSGSPPAPAGAFPISPPAVQQQWTQAEPTPRNKIPSNTSVYRKPTVVGVTTSAAVLAECVSYVRADAKTGASSPTTPLRSTTVKISMKPKTPSPSRAPAIPALKVEPCRPQTGRAHACEAEHGRGMYSRAPYVERASRSPSPTKTIPNFARQYSIEGDSIFGYKVRDPLGTEAGADKSASNSDEETPKSSTGNQTVSKAPQQKRTLTDRWPWIRRDGAKGSGRPPAMPAPDPPVLAPVKAPAHIKLTSKRPVSTYVSPFEGIVTPATSPPRVRPGPARSAAAAKATTTQAESAKRAPIVPRSKTPPVPATESTIDVGMQRVQDLVVLGVKVALALYIVVALWFILDALREALYLVFVPLRFVLVLIWAIVGVVGRALGGVAGMMCGRIRVLGR
ncbi:uncharacterized protein M421DRAFT_93948 [Didymella exigua CBS 183.55]|uniref:Uncharacterized protein n=1 Tax=Didymella exigua CBS 183.55 TaxID=1150837 RepID=A0A6A5RFZ8_9PLEO|nr:uncharacterized protein M421DRAFT_93948 [Didymella exigua CBS 183.55]KAF1926383.1 hypothetical protein M421DRAFT_93948 [Didymella exigua CBS 183.55]